MFNQNLSDTIAAISTPIGESGIGIVRISGKEALSIADKIFISKDGKKPSSFKTYTTHYGWIINPSSVVRPPSSVTEYGIQNTQYAIIDEVILTVMRAPKSYTKEDIVEINCHGGIVPLRKVLELVLENGARLAEPGEFTKRAFLNGRIDLTQAEAVLEIIRAKTEQALKMGVEQLSGCLSNKINSLRNELLDLLTILEANIDFPQEEIASVDLKELREKLEKIYSQLKNLLVNSEKGRILREGIHVVICGKPNVGKSSTLNALLKQERSIVTPIAGTTRDTIEEMIDIKGIPVRIVDTAGIIEPSDLIEKKALQRSKKQIALADLVILLFDGSRRLEKEDWLLIRKLRRKQILAVINKIDLKQKIEKEKLLKEFNHLIEISAKRFKNINLLEEAIANLVYEGKLSSQEPIWVNNLRHILALKEAKKFVAQSKEALDNNLSLEFIAYDIRTALDSLDKLLGKRFSEDLLDKIFEEFCIGK